MNDLFSALAAEFPREAVHWRAQSVTKDGTKAMALAYIDARDVMDRLDAVCGPHGWSNSFVETAKGRIVCTISLKVGDEWVSKSDGAGDTDVEGEKGALSDAFKRCAVQWGIGRYLYRLPAPWVPCECGEWNGKKQWKRWTDDPWKHVKNPPKAAAKANPTTATPDTDLERWTAWVDKEGATFGGKDRQFLEDWKTANVRYTNKLLNAYPDLSARLWTAFDLALDDAVASGRQGYTDLTAAG